MTVDGASGAIYEGMRSPASPRRFASWASPAPAVAAPSRSPRLYVNLAIADRAEETGGLPVDGVGLLRASS